MSSQDSCFDLLFFIFFFVIAIVVVVVISSLHLFFFSVHPYNSKQITKQYLSRVDRFLIISCVSQVFYFALFRSSANVSTFYFFHFVFFFFFFKFLQTFNHQVYAHTFSCLFLSSHSHLFKHLQTVTLFAVFIVFFFFYFRFSFILSFIISSNFLVDSLRLIHKYVDRFSFEMKSNSGISDTQKNGRGYHENRKEAKRTTLLNMWETV